VCDHVSQRYILNRCQLDPRTRYYLFVYVEDELGMSDGTLSDPMEMYIPPRYVSNTFETYPTSTWNGGDKQLIVNFVTREPGLAWIIVVGKESEQCVQMGYVKDPTDLGDVVVGGDACRLAAMPVFAQATMNATLDCVLPGSAEYAVFVYIEDANGNEDGDMGLPTFFEAPQAATISSITTDSSLVTPRRLHVVIDTTPGLLAAIVVTASSEGFASPEAVVDAVFAVGADTCRFPPQNVTGGKMDIVFTDCSLKRGETYYVVAYVEE
jgi:hypothetical protein